MHRCTDAPIQDESMSKQKDVMRREMPSKPSRKERVAGQEKENTEEHEITIVDDVP